MRKSTFKTLVLTMLVAAFGQLQAQDYEVSFALTGGTQTPDSVQVTNLDQGTSLSLNGTDILHLLAIPVGMHENISKNQNLKVYPNPMLSDGTVEFYNSSTGKVSLEICDVTGKIIAQHSAYLSQGFLKYRISGLRQGVYFAHGTSQNNTRESAVIISQMGTNATARIELESAVSENRFFKSAEELIQMQYNDGETLQFTAWFDGINSVEELIITESQTIAFEFIETVTDIEGNIYPVITIGNQTWMQENLKTTKLNNGDSIPYIISDWDWTTATGPAVNWFEHNQVYAETNKMGALYNWFAIETGMLCPTGWHVPTNDEFEEFVFYLAANGYNHDGSIYEGNNIDVAGEKIGKALAVKSGWLPTTYGEEWAIGKDQHLNNSSFFNGVGASGRYMMTGVFGDLGYLCNWWTSTPESADNAWTYFMYTEEALLIKTYYFKEGGYSVRCLKDSE